MIPRSWAALPAFWRAAFPALVALGVGAGCSCKPDLGPNNPNPDPPEEDTDATDSDPVDTAPPPPCDAPEIEPNDTIGQATPLPMETIGCGAWDAPGDIDYFVFDLDEEAWVTVAVAAKALGSIADAHLVVQAADGSAMNRVDDEHSTDATLVFPGVPQLYTIQLVEQNLQGGSDRYFYEVVAAVTKPPVEWTVLESEPNDSPGEALDLADGDVVYGDMADPTDSDWFRIIVPPGKHTVRVEVMGYQLGSAGDFALLYYDEDVEPLPHGCNNCVVHGPLGAQGKDPAFEWQSAGDEILYVRLFEVEGRNGSAIWYSLHVTLEAV